MKHLLNFIKSYISIVLTSAIYLLGGLDIALKCLLLMIVFDYVTGIASAIYNKKINSKIGLKGIIKKFMYLVIVAVCVVIDKLTGQEGVVRNLIIYFLVANDGISIIENMAKMNIPLPKKLISVLEQLKGEDESKSEASK